jgi:hypothetical protein
MNEKTLSNNPCLRYISDKLDNVFGWINDEIKEKSRIRGALHGMYHSIVGLGKKLSRNEEGAKCEFDRAQIQFHRMLYGASNQPKSTNVENEINKKVN